MNKCTTLQLLVMVMVSSACSTPPSLDHKLPTGGSPAPLGQTIDIFRDGDGHTTLADSCRSFPNGVRHDMRDYLPHTMYFNSEWVGRYRSEPFRVIYSGGGHPALVSTEVEVVISDTSEGSRYRYGIVFFMDESIYNRCLRFTKPQKSDGDDGIPEYVLNDRFTIRLIDAEAGQIEWEFDDRMFDQLIRVPLSRVYEPNLSPEASMVAP